MQDSISLALGKKHSDVIGAKLGMWLFLFTELFLFGGAFLLYATYRSTYAEDFHNAALEMNVLLGAINTIILLTSSLTVALSIAALQRGHKKASLISLSITLLLGLGFLVNKYFEWGHHISLGVYPNSPQLANYNKGEVLYYGLYYTMTGLHGLHVIIGLAVLAVVFYFIVKRPTTKISLNPAEVEKLRGSQLSFSSAEGANRWQAAEIDDSVDRLDIVLVHRQSKESISPANILKLENAGLYWHLVDIIWIFLFPLFYLIT